MPDAIVFSSRAKNTVSARPAAANIVGMVRNNSVSGTAKGAVSVAAVDASTVSVSQVVKYVNNVDTRTIERAFTLSDWVLYAGRYFIEVIHNWETLGVYGYVLNEQGGLTNPDTFENYSPNKTRIYVPAVPDLRFAGSLILFSKQSAPNTLN